MAPRLIIWEHVRGDAWLYVYPDRKVRLGVHWPDVPPVTWRDQLPEAVPEDQWYARPGAEWKAA